MAGLGLCCYIGFYLVGASGGLLFSLVLGLLITVASVTVHGLWVRGSVVVTRGLSSCGSGPSRSTACGILPDEGLNSRLLPWQSDSSPLSPQGNPVLSLLLLFYQKSWSQLAQVLQLFSSFFFQNCFRCSRPLHFHINFRINLSQSTQTWKPTDIFNWDCFESVDPLGRSWHFNYIESSINKHGIFLHLFRSSLVYLKCFIVLNIKVLKIYCYICCCLGFSVIQWVKNPSAMRETQDMLVQFLGWEDPLEKGIATYSSILDWRIPQLKHLKELDITEWLNSQTHRHTHLQLLNCVQLFAVSWTVAHQAPLSMGLPRQECWSAISFCRGPSWLRDRTWVPCIGRWILYHWVTREAPIVKISPI